MIPGGDTGQESIRKGLDEIHSLVNGADNEVTVLIHDGVRPLINEALISDNIRSVEQYGNAITVVPAIETIIETDDEGAVTKVADRNHCRMARAPQSFRLSEILNAHRQSSPELIKKFVDSAMLMKYYGYELHTVEGPVENIKITTQMDYYLFRAMVEARENEQFEAEESSPGEKDRHEE